MLADHDQDLGVPQGGVDPVCDEPRIECAGVGRAAEALVGDDGDPVVRSEGFEEIGNLSTNPLALDDEGGQQVALFVSDEVRTQVLGMPVSAQGGTKPWLSR